MSDASDGTYAATLALTCSDLSGKDVYFKVQDASGNLSAAAGPGELHGNRQHRSDLHNHGRDVQPERRRRFRDFR